MVEMIPSRTATLRAVTSVHWWLKAVFGFRFSPLAVLYQVFRYSTKAMQKSLPMSLTFISPQFISDRMAHTRSIAWISCTPRLRCISLKRESHSSMDMSLLEIQPCVSISRLFSVGNFSNSRNFFLQAVSAFRIVASFRRNDLSSVSGTRYSLRYS